MTTPKRFSRQRYSIATLSLFMLCSFASPLFAAEQTGTLQLTILDAVTGKPVPARVEIQGADEAYHVAADALRVGGDCDMSDEGAGFVDLASTLAGFADRIDNPYTKSTQFYSDGTSSVPLPTGRATIRVFKGPEYKVPVVTVDIQAAETVQHTVTLTRWANRPQDGWYSADDHLHIPRPVPELNPAISKMMQAEDIHVANLLQMGKVKNFTIAPQHAHGPDSHYQEGQYILAAGQENPRTHFLGHTITLGAQTALHKPEEYLIYRLIWEEAVKQGGINGFAHAYFPEQAFIPIGPHNGAAVVLPHNLLHFMEVLQFDRSDYTTWYEILTLGFRVAPTAGTDYPCGGQTIPGHERFYTKVEGSLSYANWLEGVRKGRTFVTTGPLVEFRINDQDIGSEIVLEEAGTVQVTGRVVFDPEQDDVSALELIHNGHVVDRFSRVKGADHIAFSLSQPVKETSWFAVRSYGARLTENSDASPLIFSSLKPRSNLHSAPIYVTLKNRPGVEHSAQAKKIAYTWLARLEDLETVLAEDNMEYLAPKLEVPNLDAVPKDILVKNRPGLLKEIQVAKDFFKTLAQ